MTSCITPFACVLSGAPAPLDALPEHKGSQHRGVHLSTPETPGARTHDTWAPKPAALGRKQLSSQRKCGMHCRDGIVSGFWFFLFLCSHLGWPLLPGRRRLGRTGQQPGAWTARVGAGEACTRTHQHNAATLSIQQHCGAKEARRKRRRIHS